MCEVPALCLRKDISPLTFAKSHFFRFRGLIYFLGQISVLGLSTGMHNPAKCIGVGQKSSWSQRLDINSDRKGSRAWGGAGAGGPDHGC